MRRSSRGATSAPAIAHVESIATVCRVRHDWPISSTTAASGRNAELIERRPIAADVRDRSGRASQLHALVPPGAAVEMVEEPLAATRKDRYHGHIRLVNEAGAKVLLNSGDAAGDPHIGPVRRPFASGNRHNEAPQEVICTRGGG